jgi:hypothetical protein
VFPSTRSLTHYHLRLSRTRPLTIFPLCATFRTHCYCRRLSIVGTILEDISLPLLCSPLPRWKSRDCVAPWAKRTKKKRYTTARRVPPQAKLRGCGPLRASPPPPSPADISGPVSEVADCDVAQAGFTTLRIRLFELI